MDNIPQSDIDYQEAHINENHSTLLIAVCTVFTGLALVAFVLRILARKIGGYRIGLDDYLAFAAAV